MARGDSAPDPGSVRGGIAVASATLPSTGTRARRSPALLSHKSGLIGLALLVVVLIVTVVPGSLARYDPIQQRVGPRLVPASAEYLLGTDSMSRDVWSRLVWGARVSLGVSLSALAAGGAVGVLMGLMGGYAGGRIDRLLNGLVDLLMAFPGVVLAIFLASLIGQGFLGVTLAIAAANVPRFARLSRGETLRLKALEFITAARLLGASSGRIVWRHILPNLLAPLVVLATLRISTGILTEATLSFLGLGFSPDVATWGTMIAEGKVYLQRAPWLSLAPGGAIMVTVLAFNLLGDALRDVLDPRLRGEAAGMAARET